MSTEDERIAAWDAQAEAWASYEEINERGFARLNDRMIVHAAVPPGGRVLEVACGLGSLSARFSEQGATVVATDFSPAMVEKAAAKGLDARVLDADAALGAGGWDAVVSRMGAFFFPHVDRWLVACRDALRPGGRLVLGLWGHPHEVPLVSLTDEVAREHFGMAAPPPHGIYRPGGPDPWPDMLKAAGFSKVTAEDVPVATPFGTAENAVAFLQALAGDLAPMVGAERTKAFWADVAERMPVRDGMVEARAVVVSGRRPAG